MLGAKIESVLNCGYRTDRLEVVVASDGSTDGTEAVVKTFAGDGVRLLALDRGGKNAAVNAGVVHSEGRIIVLSDADSLILPGSLDAIADAMSDPAVGAVTGEYRYESEPSSNAGQYSYWSLERLLRRAQSASGSTTAVTGALLAVRRELFVPLPPDVTDDYYIAAMALASGTRVVVEPDAVAVGPPTSRMQDEFSRKVRIFTGGLRGVFRTRRLLDPRRDAWLAVQIASHKLLRRLAFVPLALTALSAAALAPHDRRYRLVVVAHALLHGLALLAFVGPRLGLPRSRLLTIPGFFDMTNLAAAIAVFNAATGERRASRLATWETGRREADDRSAGS